jgi:hypothetical protein
LEKEEPITSFFNIFGARTPPPPLFVVAEDEDCCVEVQHGEGDVRRASETVRFLLLLVDVEETVKWGDVFNRGSSPLADTDDLGIRRLPVLLP